MNIEDFFPKYPNINETKYPVLNPYDDGFYNSIYRKKEFYENKLEKIEGFPSQRGILMKNQQTIARFLSSHTPYSSLLLVHEMGSGKSCSSIGAVEQIKREHSTIDGAIIVARGEGLLDNFTNELLFRCTGGEYIPDNYEKLTQGQKAQRIRKKREGFYTLKTMQKFSKEIKSSQPADIISKYSNKIIIIDEVHNLRIQPDKKKETLEVYQQFHRMLHLVENCKILLMSGTPMKDSPDEIASVMNLILPLDKQLPYGNDFIAQYMNIAGDTYTVNPSMALPLKNLFKGRVSFLRSMYSEVQKKYIGQKYGDLKYLIVDAHKMSRFQTDSYNLAWIKDRTGKQGVYSNSREATLAVYPDRTWGSQGFKKYISFSKRKTFDIRIVSSGKERKEYKKKYKLSEEYKREVRGPTKNDTLDNIRKYSCKYAAVLEYILKNKNKCSFVYSSVVHGSGAILFSLLMELLGYTKASGKEVTKSPRYAILTGETSTKKELQRIRDKFNSKDNINGEYIQVIIGSRTVSEGLSFKHVQFEAILTPHFNYSETAQALARGIRLGSHNDLIDAGITPVVSIMQTVSVPDTADPNIKSIDLYLYKISEDKDVSIRRILRLIMESAFDCALNYYRNHIEGGVDGSRECDYTTCDYKCDGINMRAIRDGLDNKELDYSTYQLYYTNPYTANIQKRIETILRRNVKMDIDSLFKNLEGEYSEWQIRNALQSLTEQIEGKEFDYRQFLEVYSRSTVKKIMNKIEILFRTHFHLNFDMIKSQLTQYTDFEILTAMSRLINENVVIYNRFGYPSYLKEQHNVYFLVNNLSVEDTFNSGYYTEYPNILTSKTYDDLIIEMYGRSLPTIVKQICRSPDMSAFSSMIKSMPIEIQKIFLEAALVSKKNKKNKKILKYILNYYKNYITTVDNTVVSTLQENKGILRCVQQGGGYTDWTECLPGYGERIARARTEIIQKKRTDNPYGIIGLINPQKNDAFCLVDISKESEATRRLQGKKKGGAVKDTRSVHTGKKCSSWKLSDLITIAVDRLKIDPPESFTVSSDRKMLLNSMLTEPKYKYAISTFTQENLQNRSLLELQRIAYWVLSPRQGGTRGVAPICSVLRKWLKSKDLIIIDNMCGVQGKRKITEKKEKKINFRLDKLVPRKNKTKFREMKEISTMMNDCFGIQRFSYEITDDTWVFIYIRKMVGFAIIRDNKFISICIATNYRRRKGIATEALGAVVKDTGVNILEISNTDPNYKKLIRFYKTYGFNITKDTGRTTTMKYK